MGNGYFTRLLTSYGVSATVIAVAVAVICIVSEKIFSSKLKNGIKDYVPFIAGVLITFLYNLIFINEIEILSEEILYSGLCSGSLGVIIKTAVRKIANGKKPQKNKISLLIEGIICNYVSKDLSVAVAKIEKIVIEKQTEDVTDKIVQTLTEHTDGNVNEDEISNLACLILEALNALNS